MAHMTKRITQTFTHDGYDVHVVYVEWPGGGETWEFEIARNGRTLHLSENGYGQPLPAAADAYEFVEEFDHEQL